MFVIVGEQNFNNHALNDFDYNHRNAPQTAGKRKLRRTRNKTRKYTKSNCRKRKYTKKYRRNRH